MTAQIASSGGIGKRTSNSKTTRYETTFVVKVVYKPFKNASAITSGDQMLTSVHSSVCVNVSTLTSKITPKTTVSDTYARLTALRHFFEIAINLSNHRVEF